ncbi:hypothetical protein Bca52824_054549 [Brassica carinata]|uniref:Uncharacterized protein n=1 Tax=Brassica carinata TaxID=52824 RepID=A0A8X7RDP2_BRACI|nr:hypothetical protein Bca52824_054549 [Brassica carinata]
MDDLQQATRMYTSCADPTENAARKQRVLVSDALGDMEVAPHRIINAAIETHAIQAQLLAQHMVLPPAIIPAPSELVSNVQDQRQSTTVTTGKKRGRPAKPKDKPKDMRIIPKTFVGPRPVAVFCQLFKHPWEQLLDLSKGEESPANINVTNIPLTSTTPAAAPTPHMTVDDLLGAPGRESLTVLDPLRRGRATWMKRLKQNLQETLPTGKGSGGYGIAIHNTGATSFETRKEEMIIENGGEEPGMLAFLEDAHRNRKTGDICDKKVKQIVETVKEKINDQLTQGRSTETNHLTQAEINTLVLRETPIIKGHRFGFGTLPEPGQPPSSARFMPNLDQDEQLQEKKEKHVEVKSGLNEADVLIRKMNLEKDFKQVSSPDANQSTREELMEPGMADVHAVSVDQSGGFVMSMEKIDQSSDKTGE